MIWSLRRDIRELKKTLRRYETWIERAGLRIRTNKQPESRRAA
jgi:hypothetical protein